MSPFLSLCVLVVSLFCLPYFFPCSSICFILVSSACCVFLGLLISMPMSSLRVFHLVNCYFMCTVSSFASRFVLICSCYVIMCFHFPYHPSVYIYILSLASYVICRSVCFPTQCPPVSPPWAQCMLLGGHLIVEFSLYYSCSCSSISKKNEYVNLTPKQLPRKDWAQ